MLKNTLQALGLSDTEIKVYLTLLPLGTVPASTVGLRMNIPRSTAKYTCEQLEKKSLITSQNKNGAFFYTAHDPEALFTLLNKQKSEIDRKESDLNRMLGSLKELFRADLSLPKVRFFEGVEGIKKMFDDVLKDRKPIYGCLYYDPHFHPDISTYLNETYIPERSRLHFPSWMLFSDDKTTREYQKNDQAMNRISLLIPKVEFPFEVCFHIYGEKIAFYSYRTADLMGVIIENPYIQKTQFSLFKMAWNFARALEMNKNYRKVELG